MQDECGSGLGEFGSIRDLPGAVLPVRVIYLHEGGMASDGDSVSGRGSRPSLSGTCPFLTSYLWIQVEIMRSVR